MQRAYYNPKKKIFGYTLSQLEINDIVYSWLLISLAFAILQLNGFAIFKSSLIQIASAMLLSMFTVGIGFVFHEMGHKITAQHYGLWAEYRAFRTMLHLGLAMSFLGFIFIAPGAVMIGGRPTKRENGIISLAGPLVNFILAAIFLILALIPLSIPNYLQSFFSYGFWINTLLGLFNLIPFAMLDGKKIFRWNKQAYFVLVALGILLLVVRNNVL